MTPIEAATIAVRGELNKMAHDPKEIARLAVKAYLEAATGQLASTGEHATEDFFTTRVVSTEELNSTPREYVFPNAPRIPRLPAVFCNGSPEQANNEVQVTTFTIPTSPGVQAMNVDVCEVPAPQAFQPIAAPAPEPDKNCWTASLLKLIEEDASKPALIPSVFMDLETHPAEPFSMSYTLTEQPKQPPILESEVIVWLYKELVEMQHLNDNDVLDLSRTADGAGLDSLDVVELVIAAEEAFGIEISDAAIDTAHNLHDMVRTIVNLRNNK